MGSGATGSTTSSSRRGSALTDKQLAYAVRDGKQVSVWPADGGLVSGWVFGLDDFHIGLVTSDQRILLVHKAAPKIEITDSLLSELPDQDLQKKLKALVEPFKKRVMDEHFRISPATT